MNLNIIYEVWMYGMYDGIFECMELTLYEMVEWSYEFG